MHSDPDPRFPVVVLPLSHSLVAGCCVVLWLLCLGWGVWGRSWELMALSALMIALSLSALVDARTARVWVSGDRHWLRRYAFYTKSFAISDVSFVDYDPPEHFEIRFIDGRRLRFPAIKGRDLAELARALEGTVRRGIGD